MSVVDEYLASLGGPEKAIIKHVYEIVRAEVPDATEEISYGMPAFIYKGKGLMAVMANKNFLSLYPFCAISRLGLDFSEFETTSGSIHFSSDKPIPDEMLKAVLEARKKLIGG
jgi:uncharacterized protein YdhG (YjbR/CyaY superfamily)